MAESVKNVGVTDIIQPGEIIPISWDFAGEMGSSEEITSIAVTAVNGSDVDVTSTIIKTSAIEDGDQTNSKVSFVVQSLVASQIYKVTIMATINANKVLEADVKIPVRER